MKLVVEGVMEGNLPWGLVFTGVFIAIIVEILGIPVLPFAIGLYLPIYLSTPIMIGGLIRLRVEKRKMKDENDREDIRGNGILFSSGLIAGEGLIGILLAVFAVLGIGDKINLANLGFSIGKTGGCIVFVILIGIMIRMITSAKYRNLDAPSSDK